jgi:predicted small secreted protein
MIRKCFTVFLAALWLVGLLAGCNTIEGAGKDIQRGGKVISDGAREVKNKM